MPAETTLRPAAAPRAHARHFADAEQERTAAQQGMWLFLVSELLLFGGLFTAYGLYRYLFPDAFVEGSRHLDLVIGTTNTVVLLTSSLTVAAAVHFARHGSSRRAALMLALSILLALVFLGFKAIEYTHHLHTGALPGRYYALQSLTVPAASLFFTFYFFATGLHALHVIVGAGLLSWIALRAARGEFSEHWYTPVELSGMYWHLVDLIWIFLYPLLYLV